MSDRKRMDRDISALALILKGCRQSRHRMIRANLIFAWDKFVAARSVKAKALIRSRRIRAMLEPAKER